MSRAERLAFLVVGAVVATLLIAAVVEPEFFPTNDGPHHLFGAFARAHFDDPRLEYARFFIPNQPTSANGFSEVFALLEPALGWKRAHAWTLGVIVAVWMAGALTLAHVLSPAGSGRRWLSLVVATVGLGWPLYHGFFSFVLGGGLTLLWLAAAVTLGATPRSRVVLALFLVVIALVHFFMAMIAGLLLLALRMGVVDGKDRLKELALVAATGLPAAVVALLALGATANHGDGTVSVPWDIRLAALGACTVGGPPWRQVAFAALVVVAALALVLPAGRDRGQRAMGAAAAVLCTTPLWLPWDVLGWQHGAVRPLPVAASVLVLLLPVERLPRAGRALTAVAAAAFALSSAWWARGVNLRASSEIADVIAAAEAPLPGPAGYRWPFFTVSLPVEGEAGMLRWDPLRGLGSLFGVTHGGFPAYAHVVSPQAHTLLLRPDVMPTLAPPPLRSRFVTPLRSIDDGAARRAALEPLVGAAVQTDGVIVFERPEDHEVWRARGYTVDVEKGQVIVARFTGCALDVTSGSARAVATTPSPARPGLLTRTDEVPAGTTRLDRLPCGPLDVQGCDGVNRVTLDPAAPAAITCP